MELDGEGRDVEPGGAQTGDVAKKFAPGHLEGLDDFAIEVGRRLGEFGKRGDFERHEAGDGAAGEITNPAGLEDPGVFSVEPFGTGSEDAALHLKRSGIEFDDGKSAEEFFLGIK